HTLGYYFNIIILMIVPNISPIALSLSSLGQISFLLLPPESEWEQARGVQLEAEANNNPIGETRFLVLLVSLIFCTKCQKVKVILVLFSGCILVVLICSTITFFD